MPRALVVDDSALMRRHLKQILEENGGYEVMAVRNGMRGLGIGGCILETLMKNARNAGRREVFLNAQTRVLGFYVAHGYEPQGEEFLEAYIPHIRMRCAVSKDDPAL